MARRSRLDAELVRRGLARSREHAVALIAEGRVAVSGQAATKAGHRRRGGHPGRRPDRPRPAHLGLPRRAQADRRPRRLRPAGRGPAGAGRRRLDRGLHRGAAAPRRGRGGGRRRRLRRAGLVAAHRRAGARARAHQRPHAHPRADRRPRRSSSSPTCPSSRCASCCPPSPAAPTADADLLPMVKPQFEVGRERLGAGGVVRDPAHRADAVRTSPRAPRELGWGTAGVVASPLPGTRRERRVLPVVASRRRTAARGRPTAAPSRKDRMTQPSDGHPGRCRLPAACCFGAHTGRRDIVDLARSSAARLAAAGITVRVLEEEAAGARHRRRRGRRRPVPRPPAAPRSCWCSAGTARSCGRPSSPTTPTPRSWASTSAGSASSPRPSPRPSRRPSPRSSAASTPWRSGWPSRSTSSTPTEPSSAAHGRSTRSRWRRSSGPACSTSSSPSTAAR